MQYSFENEYCLIIGIQIEAMLGIHGEIEDSWWKNSKRRKMILHLSVEMNLPNMLH